MAVQRPLGTGGPSRQRAGERRVDWSPEEGHEEAPSLKVPLTSQHSVSACRCTLSYPHVLIRFSRIRQTSTAFTYSAIFTGSPQFTFSFLTDFKTEEELQSYIHEDYQKTMATGETMLYSCAQNMISTIKAFLKSKGTKDLEVRASR